MPTARDAPQQESPFPYSAGAVELEGLQGRSTSTVAGHLTVCHFMQRSAQSDETGLPKSLGSGPRHEVDTRQPTEADALREDRGAFAGISAQYVRAHAREGRADRIFRAVRAQGEDTGAGTRNPSSRSYFFVFS
jgi:hypothetical protein